MLRSVFLLSNAHMEDYVMHSKQFGILIVSLDFELFWGMQDSHTLSEYEDHVLGGRKAIPRLLELFQKGNGRLPICGGRAEAQEVLSKFKAYIQSRRAFQLPML